MIKAKTCVLILLLLFELLTGLRYTIGFGKTYNFILILQQYIQAVLLFQISYFFIKKAAHYVEDNEKIRKLMRIVTYICLIIFAFVNTWQIISENHKSKNEGDTSSSLCHTWYFFTANLFQGGAAVFFIWTGLSVRRTVDAYNRHTNALLSNNSTVSDVDQNDRQA